jgi:uridine kinase
MSEIRVRFEDGSERPVPFHSEIKNLQADLPPDPSGLPWIGAVVNNDVTSLSYPLESDSELRLLTMADPHGWPIYARTASFLLAKTAHELFPEARFSVRYALGSGFYCLFERPDSPAGITAEETAQLEAAMHRTVAQYLPIERRKIGFSRAVELFEASGQRDLLNLLQYRTPPRVVLHVCGDFYDLAQGPLAPSSGLIPLFQLVHHAPGFVLQLPTIQDPRTVPVFVDQPHLFKIFHEHLEWGRILGVSTVGRLNEMITTGEAREVIHLAEALHEKKTALIADRIHARRHHVRLVQVAGPSSAGKTTFSKRLAIQLRVNGLQTAMISLDDYFVGRDRTPRDEAGGFDFEHIEALDLELFNRNLEDLIAGREVDLPSFNFETKTREFRGRKLTLGEDQVLIIEGIHGLNPLLTARIPDDRKFLVYINAMSQLGIDSNHRISTTDNRLIRRLVRDSQFRKHTALETLRQWASVRRGEERWIFPFQDRADAVFNSALDYELAVLKPLAEPLLMQVKPCHVEYAEARRLGAFLLNFLAIAEREVPSTSILREYIGRSGFRY